MINTRIVHKLLFISFSFSLPIAVMLYFMTSAINRDIRFAEMERLGNEYARPLIQVLRQLTQHRYLTLRAKAGDKSAAQDLPARQAAVDEAPNDVESVDRRLGVALQFTDVGLSQRNRDSARASVLRKEWESLKAGAAHFNPQESEDRHERVIHTVRTMLTQLGDTSNLILDPDLDTYYLMDISLLAFPNAEERLAATQHLGETLVIGQQPGDPAERLRLSTLAALLKTSDVDRMVAGARTALNEDANFQGVSESLQKNLNPILQRFVADVEPFLGQLNKLAAGDALDGALEPFLAAGRRAREANAALGEVAMNEMDRMLEVRIESHRRLRTWALLLTALALLVTGSLVYLVARSITAQVSECVSGLRALADKDLTQSVRVHGTGELRQMAQALVQATHGMREAVASIGQNAEILSRDSASQQIASQQMAANTEETSTQAKMVSSAADHVSKNVQIVATATEEMSASIKEVARQAFAATKVASEAVEKASQTSTAVLKLGQSSSDIGNVVKVITSIAEQTNLLALNATIEAARAGDVVCGFAVVANEVKELAKETARATEDIGQKIQTIQNDTRAAVTAITEISAIINRISDTQNTIATAVEQQTVTTRDIGRNIHEAAKGTTEIARNILGVAEAAQNTAVLANQTQSAAVTLSRMSRELTELVSRFKCL